MENQNKRTSFVVGLLFSLLLVVIGYGRVVKASNSYRPVVHGSIIEALKSADKVNVIVSLRQDSLQIAGAQQSVLSNLSSQQFRITHQYRNTPILAGEVTAEGLVALQNNPLVKSIRYDQMVYATMDEASKIGRVPDVQSQLGVTGKNIVVAILDDGIDSDNRDFTGRIIAEKCFSSLSFDCPNGKKESNSANVEATQHGTNIAGIIASNGSNGYKGVAPDAKIVAVKVLDNQGAAPYSDIFAGLDWILTNQSRLNVDIINMSLGSIKTYNDYCDKEIGEFSDLFTKLKDAGIAIFIASGNGGVSDGIAFPACLSSVIAVGATYDDNLGREPDFSTYREMAGYEYGDCADLQTYAGSMACFSNSSKVLKLVAPGSKISSSGWNNGVTTFSGTSQASPFAAGVAALVLSVKPNLSPDQLLQLLIRTGTRTFDSKNNLSFPLVNAYEAIKSVKPATNNPPQGPWPTNTPKAINPLPTRQGPWPTNTPKAINTPSPTRQGPWPTNTPKAINTPSPTKQGPWPTNTPKAINTTPWPTKQGPWPTREAVKPQPTVFATRTTNPRSYCFFPNLPTCQFESTIALLLDDHKNPLPPLKGKGRETTQ